MVIDRAYDRSSGLYVRNSNKLWHLKYHNVIITYIM